MNWEGSDRRQHPRVRGDFILAVHGPDSSAKFEIKDVSASGICCLTDSELDEMTLVQLELLLDDDPVQCRGAVVRCEPIPDSKHPRYEVAIFFTEIRDNDRDRIAGYVERELETA